MVVKQNLTKSNYFEKLPIETINEIESYLTYTIVTNH